MKTPRHAEKGEKLEQRSSCSRRTDVDAKTDNTPNRDGEADAWIVNSGEGRRDLDGGLGL